MAGEKHWVQWDQAETFEDALQTISLVIGTSVHITQMV